MEKATGDPAIRSRRIYWILAIATLAVIVLVSLIVSAPISQASRLEHVATEGGCVVQWVWKYQDTWIDSTAMRQIAGSAVIGFHQDPATGRSWTDEDWLRVSEALRPFSHRIQCIDFNGSDVGDQSIGDLTAYPDLRTVSLLETKVTPNGVEYLAALPKLNVLYVESSQLTATSVEALKDLKQFHYLAVRDTGSVEESVKDALDQLSRDRGVAVTIW